MLLNTLRPAVSDGFRALTAAGTTHAAVRWSNAFLRVSAADRRRYPSFTPKPRAPLPTLRVFLRLRSEQMLCFFNLAGAVYDPDVIGIEVETIDKARVLAAENIAEVIRDRPNIVWAGEEVRLEVTDESQMVLFTVIVVGIDAPAVAGHPSSFRP
jgi:hypothetical protein